MSTGLFNPSTVQQAVAGQFPIELPHIGCSAPSNLFEDSLGNTVNVDGVTPCTPKGSGLAGERRTILVCNNGTTDDLLISFSEAGIPVTPSASSHSVRIKAGQTLKADLGKNVVPWIISTSGTATAVAVTWQEMF